MSADDRYRFDLVQRIGPPEATRLMAGLRHRFLKERQIDFTSHDGIISAVLTKSWINEEGFFPSGPPQSINMSQQLHVALINYLLGWQDADQSTWIILDFDTNGVKQ